MKPYYEDREAGTTIYCGDALCVLRGISAQSVQCVVTSPPYWGLRDYNVAGQLGIEESPDEYVRKIVEIFREVKRVLKNDGTIWLNLGDSYSGSGKGLYGNGKSHGTEGKKQKSNIGSVGVLCSARPRHCQLKSKNLVGIPWRVAFALQADGWYLRSDIIWSKPNPMPESITDRPTRAHEYLFLLAKSKRYFYDVDAIKEKAITEVDNKSHQSFGVPNGKVDRILGKRRKESGKRWKRTMGRCGTGFKGHSGDRLADGTTYVLRNKRSVWEIATQPHPAHVATFPEKLVEPCVLAGCPEGEVVCDPFAGSGVTGFVARRLGRKVVLIDLKEEYCMMMVKRLGQAVFAF